jgi:hypothetical protein
MPYLIPALPKYTLTRIDGEERTYETPLGVSNSVTTVLDITGDKQGLMEWRESIGAELADRIKNLAAFRGTGTHDWIEQYLLTGEDPCDPQEYHFLFQPYWESIKPFLDCVVQPVVMETTIHHPDDFAGTLDCIGYLSNFTYITPEGEVKTLKADGDYPSLIDWKTADKPLTGLKLYDYTLQVAAYRKGAEYVYKPMGLKLPRAVIAVAIANQDLQLIELDASALDQLYLHFLARIQRAVFIKNKKPARKFALSRKK